MGAAFFDGVRRQFGRDRKDQYPDVPPSLAVDFIMTLLIIGATGQQGGAVCDAALAAGWPVRALVRQPAQPQARALAERGVELASGDLDRPETLGPAFRGATRVFSMQALDLGQATREAARGIAAADAAADAGVAHFVYSASLWTDRPSGVPHFESKRRVRQRIAELGLPATVLEPGSFMENLLHPQTVGGVRKGRLVTPFDPDLELPMLAVADVGPAVLWCLQQPTQSIGRAFALYGERSSSRQHAAAIAAFLGRPIGCARLHPWLTRLFLGRDLSRMFKFLHEDRDAPLAVPALPITLTAFSDWLRQGRYST